MIFKRWKLVYIIVSVKILVATWNTSGLHKENNIDMYDAEHNVQYNPVAPEYPRLQPYENEMDTSDTYNGSARRSFNMEAPTYQDNSPTSNHPPLQQSYENEMYGYNTYNNPMMWGSFNAKMPAYQHNPFAPAYLELQQPYRNEACNYNPYNNPMMGGLYNFEIPTGSEPEERIHRREIKTPDIEQLVTEMTQTGQNLSSGVRLSEVDYTKRIVEIINEQELAELNSLANNSEEMPIEGLIDEHRSYDMPEQSHSLVVPQSAENSPYEYSNSTFLYNFLHSPSPFITADSIRVRFSGQFLSFLSSDQLIRVLIVLIENKLELSNEYQKEFIETIFGHIDYSLELVITKNQVVVLVEAMMRNNVPDYFEYVFLTWKMWYSFTIEEQEAMLKDAKKEYKREILVMLYLFVVNRDEDNSQQCEIFKNDIKNQYKEIGALKNGYSLKDMVIEGFGWNVRTFRIVLDTFDTCLLDIPEVFKGLDNNTIIIFRNFFRRQFFPRHRKNYKLQNLRYRCHAYYAFTAFSRKLEQINGIGKSKDVKTNSQSYFDPEYVKCEFMNWIKMLRKNDSLDSLIFVDEYKKEFINAFAIIRQIMQSDNYNHKIFLKIFNNVSFFQYYNRPYILLLFSLTNENVLRDLIKSKEWAECIQEESGPFYKHRFISDIFMNNVCSDSNLHLMYRIKDCIIRIYGALSKLNTKETIIMHREHYFFQHFLFHPRLSIFDGMSMLYYIQGLIKIGRANNKEKCDQITRDLFFNEYYYEFAMELKDKVAKFKDKPWLVEFKKSIESEHEIYKNKRNIEKEREKFRSC